jgi:hypothetical protein
VYENKLSFMFRHLQLLTFLVILPILFVSPISRAVSEEATSQIQELNGFLEGGRGVVYTLSNLKKGDTLYAYLTNTSGDLDPMLGVLKKAGDPEAMYKEIVQSLSTSEENIVEKFSQTADTHFIVWDDDNGNGYDASLQFTIPADGTYFLLAGSMVINQSFGDFKPSFTFGSYRLLLGLNAPGVGEGTGEPSGDSFAIVESNKYNKPSVHVQHLDLELTADKPLTFHNLRTLHPGDSVYARLESRDGAPFPRFFLGDFGGKPLIFGENNENSEAVVLSYHSEEGSTGLNLYIDSSSISNTTEVGKYHIVVGINAPEILKNEAEADELPVFMETKNVKIGMSIDQIVNVDQQSETFTIVGSLQMIWQHPALAFSPDSCNCPIKSMDLNALMALANKKDIFLPLFTFFNQQGNRWTQDQAVFIDPLGKTTYRERFTVTLQAPDFDFTTYPFDSQKFNVHIDLSVPTQVFSFEEIENPVNPLGDQLGEEEWLLEKFTQETTEVSYTKDLKNSRFTTTLEMKRHLIFYVVRIFVPLILILCVSWVIFFLKDYSKQLDVASGNLLVFLAFNFTISNDLPRLGYLTLLDRMIITSFGCAALVVIISVCQKRLVAKGADNLARHIDKLVLIFYPMVYITLIFSEYFLRSLS